MAAIDAHEEVLTAGLRRLEGRTKYAEAMAQTTGGTRLRLDRQATNLLFSPTLTGAIFRAWDGAEWIEAASSDIEGPGLRRAVESLYDALATPKGAAAPPGTASSGRGTASTRAIRPLEGWDPADRIALAKTISGWASDVPGIGNVAVALSDLHEERLFVNTAGARCSQVIDRPSASVVPMAIEGGKVEFDLLILGSTGGREMFDRISQEEVQATARESVALLNAHAGPSGRLPVVLDPGTAGTFAHESFGHGTEADQMLRDRSYLKPLLGQQLGPECLTLVDDGSRPGDWGSYFFDDEGFPSRRNVLVDHGRFVEVLHDRETAAVMHRTPTGNCRRADFLSRPFVRMSNTFVEPGDWSVEELIEEAKDGILLETCTSGLEDPLGGQMQIKVKKGHRIEHGRLTDIVPSMALSGRVLDVLRSVKGVGPASEFAVSPGFCGKGHTDLLPAGTGGTYLLTEAIVGPA